ncbi:response regulator [Fluoribacter dumoffii]|uniref:Transcriptional regulatory protein fixJ n=1 Tax=Fluoribacter dumoffii TaxID=463 RepID=A0A377G7N5_9GAMM|nr:response regulator [Fluoribacter dumoffii]KTC89539.1 two component response regulator PilR [Fluoribacter dumoffii NY 23]MCW8384732.1 response regulator [Fluoribacter dumoffii]MCW8417795.1 response regulator [Fluoribacter dumoffii]MCW8454363.1 response regulator [Fluoribacter dumoffii]MCW8461563.1 response regulator [Fluoribacter dumoffii]
MPHKNTTIFIVDDDPEICKSFRWLFESINLQVQTYENAKDFLDNYNNQSGCLIIDVRMPVMSGLELLEHLHSTKNQLSVIIITGYGDIAMAIRAMKAGAEDFILKPVNHQNLLEITQRCLKKIKNNTTQSQGDFQERMNSLTKREKQVMDLVVEGKLNKQIAYELNISISTVEVHRANVMRKMGVKSLAELIKINLIYDKVINSPAVLNEST